MKLTELYESETGEKAIYRKGGSDYHTLRYVRWLENRASYQADPADLDISTPIRVRIETKKLRRWKPSNILR